MHLFHFKAIIAHIENTLGFDEPYTLTVRMDGGFRYDASWRWMDPNHKDLEIIVLEKPDNPPVYVPLGSIISIQLGK